MEDYPLVTILHAAGGRIALHQADRPRVIAELTRAQRLRPGLTYALPHVAVQTRIELARCHLALSDFAAARILLQEVEDVLTGHPDLGVFAVQARDLRAELSRVRGSSVPGASALTAAELRLLPMLSTHLSFPQIGRGTVPVPQHGQVAGSVHLSQDGRRLTQRGGHPVPRAGAAGGVRTGLHFPLG